MNISNCSLKDECQFVKELKNKISNMKESYETDAEAKFYDYVDKYNSKKLLTANDYVELNKNNEILMIYNQTLLKENKELKKQLEERKYYKFYKYENNPCGSDYCFCERPCDSNMNLKCFFENGEICGFMSETLVSNHDNIEEISLNEFAHDFIKPLINANFQNKNQQKEFIKYLEDEIKTLEKDILDTVDDMDIYMKQVKSLIIEQILQKYIEITGVSDEK